jgi:TolA-binding protein
MKFLILFSMLTLTFSCIKTAEQVEREKRIETMSEQMKDSQGLVADMVDDLKELKNQINKLNGRLEELEHKNGQMNPETLTKMNDSVTMLKAQQETSSTQLNQIQNELKEQRAFIEKVTSSLSSQASGSTKSQKKSAKTELNHALELIKKDAFADARAELEPLIDHSDLTPGEKNKVLFGLGKVEYFTKNHEKSMVYFSKIYTRFPKASLAPSCLLFIGRNLEKMNKKDEAKEAFKKVIEDYPGTTEAKEAKKEL